MNLLPMHDIRKSFINCLENIGLLRCTDLLNVLLHDIKKLQFVILLISSALVLEAIKLVVNTDFYIANFLLNN